MTPLLNHPLANGFAHLRPIRETDLAHWLDYLRSDPVRRGISWRPQTTDALREFVDATELHNPVFQVRFAIARTDDDALLGTVGLHTISKVHRSADVGYDIAPDQWGQGLATAACCAIVEWAQRQGFVRIQATLLIGNETSRRVLERAGFEHEGRLRKYRWIEGHAHDVLVYSHLPAER